MTQSGTGRYRIDVVSDTHGVLPAWVMRACDGADLIVHAGDICADDILDRLGMLAPVVAVLGNNDWYGVYGPDVVDLVRFERMGVTFKVAHIPSHLRPYDTRVAICGHTHVARIEDVGTCTVVNPGSVSRPRSESGPSMARIVLSESLVESARIITYAQLQHDGVL